MKKNVSFSCCVEVGDVISEYLAVCDVHYQVDDAWGADADGNRGVTKTLIDDVEIVYILDADGNNVSNYSQSLKELVESMAGDHL